MDPNAILAAFGLNIAAVIVATWRISAVLARLDATLLHQGKDQGRLEQRVDRLETDLNNLAEKLRSA